MNSFSEGTFRYSHLVDLTIGFSCAFIGGPIGLIVGLGYFATDFIITRQTGISVGQRIDNAIDVQFGISASVIYNF